MPTKLGKPRHQTPELWNITQTETHARSKGLRLGFIGINHRIVVWRILFSTTHLVELLLCSL